MGKSKKGYNWRARQIAAGTLDNSETVKLSAKIDLNRTDLNDDQQNVNVDSSNTLALPSKKRKFKAASENQPIGKILSKKKRKHLEKVVDRKKKKEERGELVEKLKQVQGDPELLKQMVSISEVQTKGLKKQFAENDWQEQMQKSGVTLEQVIVNDYNADDIEMPKKIKLKKPQKVRVDISIDDPNVLGFEQSSSEDESDEYEGVIEEKSAKKIKVDLDLAETDELESEEKENLVSDKVIKRNENKVN